MTAAAAGERLSDADGVLRRALSTNPDLVVRDQVTGSRRLSSAAFKPDPSDNGVSVYSTAALEADGLDRRLICFDGAHVLAEASVRQIHGLRLTEGQLDEAQRETIRLDVRSDPFPDGKDDDSPAHEVAHALVVGWVGLSKNQRRDFQKQLTNVFVLESEAG